jgi:hypothetical protein
VLPTAKLLLIQGLCAYLDRRAQRAYIVDTHLPLAWVGTDIGFSARAPENHRGKRRRPGFISCQLHRSAEYHAGPVRRDFRRRSAATISHANGCTSSLSASTATVPAAGNSALDIYRTTGNQCRWTTPTLPSWIELLSGGPQNSANEFIFDVLANTGSDPRSATLTIAGQPLMIDQDGGYACTFFNCVQRRIVDTLARKVVGIVAEPGVV